MIDMKKIFLLLMMLASLVAYAQQEQPEIKFDKTVHNFGTFSEKTPVQTAVFAFTNIGKAPLIINQAIASCGCTIPSYTKEPIMPGEKGTVKVTYNGKGKFPGHFKKSITIRTNGKVEMVRLYIEGDMKEE
jgi:hypothetical protein